MALADETLLLVARDQVDAPLARDLYESSSGVMSAEAQAQQVSVFTPRELLSQRLQAFECKIRIMGEKPTTFGPRAQSRMYEPTPDASEAGMGGAVMNPGG